MIENKYVRISVYDLDIARKITKSTHGKYATIKSVVEAGIRYIAEKEGIT